MFISKITIKNYRLFPTDKTFSIDKINIPDGTKEGSGLNVFVGENACGKTSLLEAFALPVLEFKSDSFSVDDRHNLNDKTEIKILMSPERCLRMALNQKASSSKPVSAPKINKAGQSIYVSLSLFFYLR